MTHHPIRPLLHEVLRPVATFGALAAMGVSAPVAALSGLSMWGIEIAFEWAKSPYTDSPIAGTITRALKRDPIQRIAQTLEGRPVFTRSGPLKVDGQDWAADYQMAEGFATTWFHHHLDTLESGVKATLVVTQTAKGSVHVTAHTRELPTELPYGALLPDIVRKMTNERLPLVIGVSHQGIILTDLTDLPHLVVAGTTGAGKSTGLRTMVHSLRNLAPRAFELHTIDLKHGVELTDLHGDIQAKDLPGAVKMLDDLSAVMHLRYQMMETANLRDWASFRRQYTDLLHPLPYFVLVVDELAQLTIKAGTKEEKELHERATSRLSELLRLGRAAGVHVILATQRPDAEVLPGQLRANVDAVLALRVANAVQSRVALGEGYPEAADLPKIKGRGLFLYGGELTEVQVPFVGA